MGLEYCGVDALRPVPDVKNMVGAAGFEPTTSCTPCKRATKLRYAPTGQKSLPWSGEFVHSQGESQGGELLDYPAIGAA